jgi:hypothetical protein
VVDKKIILGLFNYYFARSSVAQNLFLVYLAFMFLGGSYSLCFYSVMLL